MSMIPFKLFLVKIHLFTSSFLNSFESYKSNRQITKLPKLKILFKNSNKKCHELKIDLEDLIVLCNETNAKTC